jgi:hypothetical protein
MEICDVILRLLAESVVHSVTLDQWSSRDGAFIVNAPTLSYLMERCQSLKALKLEGMPLQEDHIRVLGAYSRPGLEINLDCCKLTSDGSSALVEILGRNQGPTKLQDCSIDYLVLANGLRGNSRLKSFFPRNHLNHDADNQEALAIAGALKENKGLVDLHFCHGWMSDETWNAVCDSLKAHTTLKILNFFGAGTRDSAVITSRIPALLDMMKMNISIHTIQLPQCYTGSEHELFRGSVIPYLETNRFRPRLLAIQKTRQITYRTKVLGRGLLAVRTDPNSFWMLLSGNPEVAFPSTTATTMPAANLPTPATAADTSESQGTSLVPTGVYNRKARPY